MALKWLCLECNGLLRTGMAIRKRQEGNYHVACWFRKQEQEKENGKEQIQQPDTRLHPKGK